MTNHESVRLRNNKKETNVTNKFQGEFRTSILDLDLISYGISRDEYVSSTKNKTLVITCLDQINEYKFVWNGLVAEFGHKESFIKNIARVLGVDSVYISKGEAAKDITMYNL
jgi:hypothetical protein